jgi:hypothetical protein
VKRTPDAQQRKTIKQIGLVTLLMWLAALGTFVFGDFRSRVVPTAVALVLTAAYFAVRSDFNMKKTDDI